jgi:hypothetical protein
VLRPLFYDDKVFPVFVISHGYVLLLLFLFAGFLISSFARPLQSLFVIEFNYQHVLERDAHAQFEPVEYHLQIVHAEQKI